MPPPFPRSLAPAGATSPPNIISASIPVGPSMIGGGGISAISSIPTGGISPIPPPISIPPSAPPSPPLPSLPQPAQRTVATGASYSPISHSALYGFAHGTSSSPPSASSSSDPLPHHLPRDSARALPARPLPVPVTVSMPMNVTVASTLWCLGLLPAL